MTRCRRRLAAAVAVAVIAGTPVPGSVALAGGQGADDGPAFGAGSEPVGLAPLEGVPLVLVEQALDGSVALERSEDMVEVTLSADVLFAFDSADLQPTAEPGLTEARDLLTRATGAVTIVGHTDDVGTDEYNDDLSLRRAESVRQALSAALAAAGVEAVVDGRGEREPVAPNANEDGSDNPEGRQRNRRVTVAIPVAAGR